MSNLQVKINNHNGALTVNSLDIASGLSKRHSDVIRKLKEVLNEREFSLVEYKDTKGEIRPSYEVTKDGFILLVMNYTGYNDFKRAYIRRFNEMEAQLKQPLALPAAIENKLSQIEKAIDSIHESLQGEAIDEPRSFRSTCGCSVYQYEKKIDELHNAIKERNKEVNRMHSFQLELKEAFRYILYEAKDLYSVKKTAEKAYEELNRSHCGFYICF